MVLLFSLHSILSLFFCERGLGFVTAVAWDVVKKRGSDGRDLNARTLPHIQPSSRQMYNNSSSTSDDMKTSWSDKTLPIGDTIGFY